VAKCFFRDFTTMSSMSGAGTRETNPAEGSRSAVARCTIY
jgi:hypothetical protein